MGQADSAVVTFTPPAGRESVGGSYPFGILATSIVPASSASAAAEGDLIVKGVFHLRSTITPTTSSGRWKARHVIEVTNLGNTPVRLRLTPADPDQRLGFLLLPQTVEVPIGGTVSSQLRVRTRKPMLRGTALRLPFQVTAAPDDSEGPGAGTVAATGSFRTSVDGAFTQRPILSRAATVAGVVLAVAAVAAASVFALRATTPPQVPLAGSGPPSTPALTVTAADSQSVKLDWPAQPNLNGYKVYTVTPDGKISDVKEIDGALDTLTIDKLPPDTAQCFRLQAIRGDQSSLPSEPQCATTAAVPTTPPSSSAGSPGADVSSPSASASNSSPPASPPPSSVVQSSTAQSSAQPTATSPGVITETDYIATPGAGATFPVSDPSALPAAQVFAAGLPTGSLKAAVLRTSDYPNFGIGKPVAGRVDSYLVYVGPFASEADAKDYCAHHVDWPGGCISLRPGPTSTTTATATPTS